MHGKQKQLIEGKKPEKWLINYFKKSIEDIIKDVDGIEKKLREDLLTKQLIVKVINSDRSLCTKLQKESVDSGKRLISHAIDRECFNYAEALLDSKLKANYTNVIIRVIERGKLDFLKKIIMKGSFVNNEGVYIIGESCVKKANDCYNNDRTEEAGQIVEVISFMEKLINEEKVVELEGLRVFLDNNNHWLNPNSKGYLLPISFICSKTQETIQGINVVKFLLEQGWRADRKCHSGRMEINHAFHHKRQITGMLLLAQLRDDKDRFQKAYDLSFGTESYHKDRRDKLRNLILQENPIQLFGCSESSEELNQEVKGNTAVLIDALRVMYDGLDEESKK